MNNFGDVLRDHGIGLGKYKIGGNISVSNLNIPYALFTIAQEQYRPLAVDSLGNIYFAYGDKLVKYNSNLTIVWISTIKPSVAINTVNILMAALDKNETPWVMLHFQKSDYNYYIGIYRVNKSTGALEDGVDYYLGAINNDYSNWNFAVDVIDENVIYTSETKNGTTTVSRVSFPNKAVSWTYTGVTQNYKVLKMRAHANGSVYMTDAKGWVYRLNASTGAVIFKKETSNPNQYSNPLSEMDVDSSGNIYVGGLLGKVTSFAPTGLLRWEYNLGKWVGSLAVSYDGTKVYVCSGETGYVGDDIFDILNSSTKALIKRLRIGGRKTDMICAPNGDVYMYDNNLSPRTPMCMRETFKILN